jgi:hypothetical protein
VVWETQKILIYKKKKKKKLKLHVHVIFKTLVDLKIVI